MSETSNSHSNGHTPSTAFRHLPPRKDLNRCLEFEQWVHSDLAPSRKRRKNRQGRPNCRESHGVGFGDAYESLVVDFPPKGRAVTGQAVGPCCCSCGATLLPIVVGSQPKWCCFTGTTKQLSPWQQFTTSDLNFSITRHTSGLAPSDFSLFPNPRNAWLEPADHPRCRYGLYRGILGKRGLLTLVGQIRRYRNDRFSSSSSSSSISSSSSSSSSSSRISSSSSNSSILKHARQRLLPRSHRGSAATLGVVCGTEMWPCWKIGCGQFPSVRLSYKGRELLLFLFLFCFNRPSYIGCQKKSTQGCGRFAMCHQIRFTRYLLLWCSNRLPREGMRASTEYNHCKDFKLASFRSPQIG